MKVYILCYESNEEDCAGNILSVWSSFEGAKQEASLMAEVSNDMEAATLSYMMQLTPWAVSEWEGCEEDFYHEEPDSILHGWHLTRQSSRLVIAEYEVQHGKTVF